MAQARRRSDEGIQQSGEEVAVSDNIAHVRRFATAVARELALLSGVPATERRENQIRQAVEAALESCDLMLIDDGRINILRLLSPVDSSADDAKLEVRGAHYAVLALLAEGCSQTEIAEKLSAPLGTVSNWLSRLRKQLGVKTSVEAMLMFQRGEISCSSRW